MSARFARDQVEDYSDTDLRAHLVALRARRQRLSQLGADYARGLDDAKNAVLAAGSRDDQVTALADMHSWEARARVAGELGAANASDIALVEIEFDLRSNS